MAEKRIVLLSGEELIAPFKNEGFEVFWGAPSAYELFYEGKARVWLGLSEFRERIDRYKKTVLEFKPAYFLAWQWFFSHLFKRAGRIHKKELAKLWMDFIEELNRKGIVTIIICVDDPRTFLNKPLIVLTHAFRVAWTHSMQMEEEYRRHGQRAIFFPNYVDIEFKKLPVDKDYEMQDPERFKFDVFFVGTMYRKRRMFYRLLSKRLKGLDYFFGEKDLFYTSRNQIHFYPPSHYHIMRIYEKTLINVIYGDTSDTFFTKSWGASDRPINIGYCHGFFLCEHRRHMADLFDIDPALYTFKTLDECHKKIRFYLENRDLRQSLADKFNRQVMERYTAASVMMRMISDTERQVSAA